MKPHKPVTLIDLEGNPIPLRENVPLHCLTREYAHIVDFIWQFEETDYRIYIGASYRVGEATKHYEELLPLLLFLQDQLTFIRNGMWETLAIYQSTLGKYWEVPWYHCPQDTMYTWLNPFKGGQAMEWCDKTPKPFTTKYINDIFTEDMEKHLGFYIYKAEYLKPSVETFLKHYPDVFSKLTPWKGE